MNFKRHTRAVAALLILLAGVALADAVAEGSKVTTELTMSLEDGTVVATTQGKEPVTFTMGDAGMLKAVQQEMLGMDVGDSKEFKLSPEQAFGNSDPSALKVVPTEKIPEEHRKVGAVLTFNAPEQKSVQGRVVKVGETETTVDFNHPLAGRNLVVNVKVLKVE